MKGAWRPSLNIVTLLTSIQMLMNEPNPDDPLMADIVSSLLLICIFDFEHSTTMFFVVQGGMKVLRSYPKVSKRHLSGKTLPLGS